MIADVPLPIPFCLMPKLPSLCPSILPFPQPSAALQLLHAFWHSLLHTLPLLFVPALSAAPTLTPLPYVWPFSLFSHTRVKKVFGA